MSRGERLLRPEDLLARHVRLPAHRRLPPQEVQHGAGGDHEPGQHGLHRCRQEPPGQHQERAGVRGELPRLLCQGQIRWWVKGVLMSLCDASVWQAHSSKATYCRMGVGVVWWEVKLQHLDLLSNVSLSFFPHLRSLSVCKSPWFQLIR